MLVDDPDADLHVQAWRFTYNGRGIIEMPNRLRRLDTAVIMVHPGASMTARAGRPPSLNGVCDFLHPVKNELAARHTREVVNPFLESLRGRVNQVMFSLRGPSDPTRKKLYRSLHHRPRRPNALRGKRSWRNNSAACPTREGPSPKL